MVGHAYLYQATENRLVARSIYGQPEEFMSGLNSWLQTQLGQGLALWVAEHRHPTCVQEVTHDPRWRHLPGIDDNVHSAIIAPIMTGNCLVGVFSVFHQEPGFFSAGSLS